MNKKEQIKNWIKEHKTLITACVMSAGLGVGVTAVCLGINQKRFYDTFKRYMGCDINDFNKSVNTVIDTAGSAGRFAVGDPEGLGVNMKDTGELVEYIRHTLGVSDIDQLGELTHVLVVGKPAK